MENFYQRYSNWNLFYTPDNQLLYCPTNLTAGAPDWNNWFSQYHVHYIKITVE